MDKTIKEFADELGVTRQAIQYHVTNNFGNKLSKNKKRYICLKPRATKNYNETADKEL